MSKMSNVVFEGQSMAEQFYNVPRTVFVAEAANVLGKNTLSYKAAVDAFDDIQEDFCEYYAAEFEELVPAIIEDGVPF